MKRFLALALTSSVTLSLFALAPAADISDLAAPLKIDEWVKGKPTVLADGKGKTIYVVEFWATWCAPCRASIPHLTELQRKFKDKGVVFIGISDEKPDKVKPFVEKMGDKMDYTVAIDKDKGTSEGYMEAYGINGIPHAFIVDKAGRVAWNGHPMDDLDKRLEDMLSGKYDLTTAKKRADGQNLMVKYSQLASRGADDEELDKVARQIATIEKEIGGLNDGKNFNPSDAKKMVKFRKAMEAYEGAVMSGKEGEEVDKLAAEAKDMQEELEQTLKRYQEKAAKK
jgi:thiol-disulfide isomerase/thioredoxin